MSEKRVVIFDLDNTLVINRPAAKMAYEAAIRFLSKETKLEFDKLYNHWKRLVQKLTIETIPEKRAFEYSLSVLCSDHRIDDTLIPIILKIYEKELLANLRPLAGAKEIVSWLKEQKCLVAVAAGTDRSLAKKKLKTTQLLQFVDLVISTSEVGKMKPDHDYFQLVMDQLKVKPNQTLVVSDSKEEDINLAKKMNLRFIQIPSNNAHLVALKPEISEFLSYSK